MKRLFQMLGFAVLLLLGAEFRDPYFGEET